MHPGLSASSFTRRLFCAALSGILFASADATRAAQAINPPDQPIQAPPGFVVEQLYRVPREQHGSWVCITVDPKGRLITSDQYGGLYRLTPPPLGTPAGDIRVERIPVRIGSAQGLLCAFDSLYVVVNGRLPATNAVPVKPRPAGADSGLYRVKDTNGDDEYDQVEKLRAFEGDGEHGPHGIALAPDRQSLYIMGGNGTQLPNPEKSLMPRAWGQDQLLPPAWSLDSDASPVPAPAGWVCRTDPDGKVWTLVSAGYRNSYDIAFHASGDLFTYDSDMEWHMGLPWYRPTRVLLVMPASEYGWRDGSGKWPDYYIDTLPSVLDIGAGSPTGVTFGYGARFPEAYQRAFFISDWSYGKLYAVHIEARAAAYTGRAEVFLSGAPFPITDLAVSRQDGALYITTGGRRVQSTLLRVTHKDSHAPLDSSAFADPPTTQATLRRSLEAMLARPIEARDFELAIAALRHEDRFVRFVARSVLEHQKPERWQAAAFAQKDPQALLESMTALARTGDPPTQPKLLEALEGLEWKSLTETQQLALIRTYGLTFIRMGPPASEHRARILARLDPWLPSVSERINRELCQLLIYLDAPGVTRKATQLLREARTQNDQIHYAWVLRHVKSGWAAADRIELFQWIQSAFALRGGRNFQDTIKIILRDASAHLSETERAGLGDLLTPKFMAAGSLNLPKPRGPGRAWGAEELTKLAQSRSTGRSFTNGKAMFAAALCASCHRFDGSGGETGPDLTGAGARFGERDLIEAIVDPSREISDQYRTIRFGMRDGDAIHGRIVNLDAGKVDIMHNLLEPDNLRTVLASDILARETSLVSSMPSGLLDGLNEDEVLDLLAYLKSGGDHQHPAFRIQGSPGSL